MNKFKNILLCLIIMSTIAVNVYAEDAHSVTFKAEYDGDNISIVEDSLVTSVDNSFLPVKVIKYTDKVETVIFTGQLGNYDNGRWSNTDFSDIQFLLVLDWSSNEQFYIFPVVENSQQTANSPTTKQSPDIAALPNVNKITDALNEEPGEIYPLTEQLSISCSSDDLSVDTDFNQTGNILSASFSLKNTSKNISNVRVNCASYRNGKLLQLSSGAKKIYGFGGWNPTLNINMPEDLTGFSVKLMVWNDDSLMPYCDAVELTDTPEVTVAEIFADTPVEAAAGSTYIFRPKYNAVYSFSENGNVSVFKKMFGALTPVSATDILTYPNQYSITVNTDCVVEAVNTSGYLSDTHIVNNKPNFIVNDGDTVYFSDWSNGGRIFKTLSGETSLVCNDKATWLTLNGAYLYYHNLLDRGKLYKVEKTAENAETGTAVTE